MVKKRKIAALLMLLGMGVPLVLYFFQQDGIILQFNPRSSFSRKLTQSEAIALNQLPTYIKLAQAIETSKKAMLSDLATIRMSEKGVQSETFLQSLDRLRKERQTISEEKPLSLAIVSGIEAVFAKGHFEKETWEINGIRTYEIPYKQVVGVGVLFIFIGASLLVFSYIFQEKK